MASPRDAINDATSAALVASAALAKRFLTVLSMMVS
jgi:hypothetical protein